MSIWKFQLVNCIVYTYAPRTLFIFTVNDSEFWKNKHMLRTVYKVNFV